MGEETRTAAIDAAQIERWALAYLGRFASSAENLRRVLLRRVRRRLPSEDGETAAQAAAAIEALVARYRASGLIDDAAYAVGRARSRLRRGQSLGKIRAGLAAKGVGAEDAAAALDALREEAGDPDLAAAIAFARRRRLGPFRRAMAEGNDELRLKELGAFARAGFTRAVAEAVLACETPKEAEELARRER